MRPKPQTVFGPYRLEEELGQGGMGVVYRAVRDDGEIRMTVAVKVIHPDRVDARVIARFRRERQLLADLHHPHIARLLDAGTSKDGLPFLIMEYVDGVNILEWCRQHPGDLAGNLRLFSKLLDAVALAHRKGVIHRDIKPDNVLVTGNGEPVLLDFGIAHTLDDPNATAEGRRLLTPAYAAPEQLQGKPVTPRFDIYALGLLLMEMNTHARLSPDQDSPDHGFYADGTTYETLAESGDEGVWDPITNEMSVILATALAQDPERRYETCEHMLEDINRLFSSLTVPPQTGPFPGRHQKRPDALLLYHQQDEATIHSLVGSLRIHQLEITAASDQSSAAECLSFARVCLICLGEKGVGPWHVGDVRDILAQKYKRRSMLLLPLWLPGARLPTRESDLPSFLRRTAWFDFPGGIDDQQTLALLVARIRGHDTPHHDPLHTDSCPFRGLQSFREQDARFFFGRKNVIQRLADHMKNHAFLAVLGPSGSGKSSVVQAGLLPLLRRRGDQLAVFTPGEVPLHGLAAALFHLFRERGGDVTSAQILQRLHQDRRSLHFMIQELGGRDHGGRVCLVIDQFEELFTPAREPEHAALFLANIFHALEQADDRLAIVLTLRSDFMGHCVVWPDLNSYISDHVIQLVPMNREQLIHAVADPARLVGLSFEEGLLERIIDDVIGQAGELPLLEHALLELFKRRSGRLLSWEAYREIGGIDGALSRRAEEIYRGLDPTSRQVLRKMFTLCLINPHKTEATRRRATRKELLAVGGDPRITEPLLDGLIEARLLTTYRDEVEEIDLVEVAHEALFRRWERVRLWMEEDRHTAHLLARLRGRAQTWEESGRQEDFLPRGIQLLQMNELCMREAQNLPALVRDFVGAGLAADRRQRRRRRLVGNLMAVLTLLAIALAIFSFHSFVEATRAKRVALEEKRRAESKTLEANYHLGIAFSEKAGTALDEGRPLEAWLSSLTALTLDLPVDHELPEARGRFMERRMNDAARLLWTSPVVPHFVRVHSSRDGHYLALAGSDGSIYLVDARSGTQKNRLIGADPGITGLTFSPDGTWLAAASETGKVALWNLPGGAFRMSVHEHEGRISSLAFSPDSRQLATAGDDGQLLVRSLPDERTPLHHVVDAPVTNLAFGYDGRLFIVVAGTLMHLDINRNLMTRWPPPRAGAITALACYGRDRLVAGWADGRLTITSLADGTTLLGEEKHAGPLQVLAVDSVNERIISCGARGVLDWNLDDATLRANRLTGLGNLLSPSLNEAGVLNALDRDGRLLRRHLVGWHAPSLPIGHGGEILRVAFSPDGQTLASASADGTIGLWDHLGSVTPRFLTGHAARVNGLAFSRDGTRLASASDDHTVRLWDMTRDGQPEVMHDVSAPVSGLAFSPDGAWLAIAARHEVRLRSVNGQGGTTLKGHSGPVYHIAFSPDGRWLASASDDHSVRLWRLADGRIHRVLDGHTARVYDVAFSPDGQRLASASLDQTIRLWDPVRGASDRVLKGHTGSILGLTFSPDGTRLASASWDQTARVWDVSGDDRPLVLRSHGAAVSGVAFSPDGSRLVTSSFDHTLKLWDVTAGDSEDHTLQGTSIAIGVAFSPDNARLATGWFDHTVTLWDLSGEDRQVQVLRGHQRQVWGVAFSPDGTRLASASEDHTVRLWDLTGHQVSSHPLLGHSSHVWGVAFSPDGTLLASSSADQTVRLWDTVSQKTVRVLGDQSGSVTGLAFSPDGSRLATAPDDGTIKIWDLAGGEDVQTLQGHTGVVNGVAFSPDGTRLASASSDGTVKLWDMSAGGINDKTLRGHLGRVTGVAFSPDGAWLASSSADFTARLWDMQDGSPMAILKGHRGDVNMFLAFSPEGTHLATASDDFTVRLWSLGQLPLPPAHQGARQYYRTLLEHALYQMGYRRDGFRLFPQPHMRLGGSDDLLPDHPYHALDRPRPQGVSMVDWLMGGSEESGKARQPHHR